MDNESWEFIAMRFVHQYFLYLVDDHARSGRNLILRKCSKLDCMRQISLSLSVCMSVCLSVCPCVLVCMCVYACV